MASLLEIIDTSIVNVALPTMMGNLGATLDEIKSAYRREIARYHQDKVAQLGPELQDLANMKSQQINEAYRMLVN